MRVSAACNRYRRQCDLLWERQITTLDELLTYKENLQAEYNTLTAQRRALYCGKSRRACTRFGAEIYFSRRFAVQKPESCRCFYRMRLIESYGTGIGKIERAYKSCPMQPEFETAKGVFRVTLPNRNEVQETGGKAQPGEGRSTSA